MIYLWQALESKEGSSLSGLNRIIFIEDDSSKLFILRIDPPKTNSKAKYYYPNYKKPTEHDLSIILDEINSGILIETTISLPTYLLSSDESLIQNGHENLVKKRDNAYSIIDPILSSSYEEFLRFPYSEELLEKTKNHNISHRQFVRLAYRYLAFAKNKQALIPAHFLQGGPGIRREPKEAKRGYINHIVSMGKAKTYGINSNTDIQAKIMIANKKYPGRYKKGLTWLKEEYFNLGHRFDHHGNKTPILKPEAECLSYNQYYYYAKDIESHDFFAKRTLTPAEFYNRKRELRGRSSDNIYLPAQCYQIDAWYIPLELVSSFDRSKKVGCAIAYVSIDVYSHMYTGLYVDIIDPSWEAIRQLFYNAFTDKVAYCKRYGVHIEKDEWDVDIIPFSVFMDRGSEMIARIKRQGLFDIGIQDALTAPPRYAAAKGLVESCFNRLRQSIDDAPGAFSKQNHHDKRKKKYAIWNSKLTVDELTEYLIEEILFLNNHAKKRQLLTPEMVNDKVLPYPRDIWRWGCKRLVKGHRLPPEEIRAKLLHPATGTITKRGIEFKKVIYVSDELSSLGWFYTAGDKGSSKIDVRYSTIDSSFIYVMDKNKKLYKCVLQDSYKEFMNKDFIDIVSHYESLNELTQNPKLSDTEAQKEADKNAKQKRIIEKARKQTNKANKGITSSKSKQLKGKSGNRKDEKAIRNKLRSQEDSGILHKEETENGKNRSNDSERSKANKKLLK